MGKTRVSGTFNINRVMLDKPDTVSGIRFGSQTSLVIEDEQGPGSFVPGLILSFDGAITCPNHLCLGAFAIQRELFSVSGHPLTVPTFSVKAVCLADFQEKWGSEQTYAGQLLPGTVVQTIKERGFEFQSFRRKHVTTGFVMGGRSSGFDLPAYVPCPCCGTVYADCADIQADFTRLRNQYTDTLTEDLVPPLWEENEKFQVKLPDKEKWLTPWWIEEIQHLEKYQKKSVKKSRIR